MPRGLLVGMTDYSHQSLEDMKTDLRDWGKNLKEVCEILETSEAQLEKEDYLKEISYNVLGFRPLGFIDLCYSS